LAGVVLLRAEVVVVVAIKLFEDLRILFMTTRNINDGKDIIL
jgi:hypothetical protein